MTFTTSDGCNIHYNLRPSSRSGSPRVVLVHSLALDASVWDDVVSRLEAGADVLTYDCRGHGRSDRRTTSFSVDLFAQDLAELLDQVGWDAAAVAGCSMGGNVAQAFAGRYPSLVNALALIDTTAWYGEDAGARWQERAGLARTRGLAALVEFQLERWVSEPFRRTHPDRVQALVDVFEGNDIDCYAASCAMLGVADSRPFLESLDVPAAIVVGEEDYATPVSAARHLHTALEGSTLTVLPAARHLTPVERPDEVAATIGDLLDRQSQARRAR